MKTSERRLQQLLQQLNGCGCCSNPSPPGSALARMCTSAQSPSLASSPSSFAPYNPSDAQRFIEQYPNVDPALAIRCYTSQLIGRRSNLVLHGGGNTSVKLTVTNVVGEAVDILAVKGSGYNLDAIVPKGFPLVSMSHLNKLLDLTALSDVEMVNELRTHMQDSSSPNPSVETLLHALLPAKFVDHSHADAIVALADLGAQSEPILRQAFQQSGLTLGIVPYAKPGIDLSLVCTRVYRANPNIDALILLQHGLVTWGNTARESYELHIKCVDIAASFIHSKMQAKGSILTSNPRVAAQATAAQRRLVLVALRGVLTNWDTDGSGTSAAGGRWIVKHRPDAQVLTFCNSNQVVPFSQIGTITPDHVIRTKGLPCVLAVDLFATATAATIRTSIVSSVQEYVESYHAYFQRNNTRVGGGMVELDPYPRVFLVPGLGLITVGRTTKACDISADIYVQSVPVILSCFTLTNNYVPVSEEKRFEVEYWELEQRKLKLNSKAPGALDGQVVYITGGASGMGLATAVLFQAQGANVFIADVRHDRIDNVLRKELSKGPAAGCQVDVTQLDQVQQSFDRCIDTYGGVDIVVSNAGVVVQASPGMASCSVEDLQKSMSVNFYGHQWVSSTAVTIMLQQQTGGSLLYNISKAPLNPGPKLGPYAIAKSAALALMRQYAVEYGEHGIRANAVNADRVMTNLFDMKLVEERAQARGLTAAQYFSSNLLKRQVFAVDAAKAFLHLTLSLKTTAAIVTVDGGNIAAAVR